MPSAKKLDLQRETERFPNPVGSQNAYILLQRQCQTATISQSQPGRSRMFADFGGNSRMLFIERDDRDTEFGNAWPGLARRDA